MRLTMDCIDRIGNAVGLWLERRSKHSRWLTYSWVLSWFGVTALRADYVTFTARRYVRNVRQAVDRGYQPMDWQELDEAVTAGRLIPELAASPAVSPPCLSSWRRA